MPGYLTLQKNHSLSGQALNPPRFIGHPQVGLFCFISLLILIIGKQLVDEAERLAKEILDGIIKGADLPDDES